MDPHATISGILARHLEITPTCRGSKGAEEAFKEAAEMLRREYEGCVRSFMNENATYHLALTVERPKESG